MIRYLSNFSLVEYALLLAIISIFPISIFVSKMEINTSRVLRGQESSPPGKAVCLTGLIGAITFIMSLLVLFFIWLSNLKA